jgi:hypothetical protein
LTPKETLIRAFEPSSTCRANKRAEYDAMRDKKRTARLQKEREQLQRQIKKVQQELLIMGRDLSR